jgi:hypothetical protein
MKTPLAARSATWLSAVEVNSALVLSAQTNAPVLTASPGARRRS